MRYPFLVVAALAFAWTSQGACYAGPITYSIDDYPTLQNGDHVTGSITTDGTIGSIAAGNITAWSYIIKDPGGTILESATSATGGVTDVGGDIRSTTTALFFDVPPTPPATVVGLSVFLGSPSGGHIPDLRWSDGGGEVQNMSPKTHPSAGQSGPRISPMANHSR
jgi:hypothetical protein